MSADVELIRSRADLIEVVGQYVKLRRSGAQYVGLCPFHREKTGSFYLHAEKRVWRCHGCGAGGDAFTFLQRIEGIDFPEAKRRLAAIAGVPIAEEWGPARRKEYAIDRESRELLDHYHMMTGRRIAAFPDQETREWTREDLEQARAVTAIIISFLEQAEETGPLYGEGGQPA